MPDEAVVRFLREQGFKGVDPQAVATVTTHISLLLIGGDTALKLKRPVRLPYADFSTPELRLAACRSEVDLNRRTAPELYRGVHRITREADGAFALDGDGELVDAHVEMHRFDDASLLDRQAEAGTLDIALMGPLGAAIADFHQSLAPVARTGGAARMAGVLDVNEAALATTDVFPADEVSDFNRRFRAALSRLAPLLDQRAEDGKVRRGHGDLHLRNICLIEGRPVLFDCLEFNEELGTTDVFYDLAFLLMDLWHRRLFDHANLVMNRYLDLTGDEAGLPALPFFMAVRAAVRAHVGATAAASGDGASTERAEARRYFDLAGELLEERRSVLVAVGGLSGSGKSTVARAVASGIGPAPGARTISSDRLRKRLFGVAPETRLPATAYRPEVTATVYETLCAASAAVLGLGHAVVADATFERRVDRDRIAAVAQEAKVPFVGLWLDVPAGELLRRVGARTGDPSDATPDVVRRQLAQDHGDIAWMPVPGTGTPEAVAARARAIVGGADAEASGASSDT
ncbi:aminoglycoside phosphotransferase [Jiella endophytica]|uniref:Aminoglycoside phosphotransferase n=2 Tax=Jiella endophytica TaxID=2558362 RepID=A0A4Y8RV87_9HYPH|nr:aminoglycoside phosphotransferase [Jiella endophytica]